MVRGKVMVTKDQMIRGRVQLDHFGIEDTLSQIV